MMQCEVWPTVEQNLKLMLAVADPGFYKGGVQDDRFDHAHLQMGTPTFGCGMQANERLKY